MANQNDSFIDEVTEDLRRDRLFLAMRRYGWVAILLILVIVGGAAWREWSQAREARSAQDFGDRILAAEKAGDDAAAHAAALAEVPASGKQAVLRDLLAGGAFADAGQVADAASRYEAAAAAAGDDAVMSDLALLKSVLVQGRDMDPAERDAALSKLSAPGAPFELLALEFKAVALVDAGRRDDAVTLIRQIQQRAGLSQAMRGRLSEMLITLGIDPDPESAEQSAPDPTRAAEVMPPPPQN